VQPDKRDTPPPRLLLGLALAGLAVFITEMALMRAVAQVTWPPFAFLALSAAMLGGGIAGTLLAIRPSWALAPASPFIGGIIVAVASPLSLVATLKAGLEPLRVGADVGSTLVFIAVLLGLALPFVGFALALSALLDRFPKAPFRVYAADLLGGGIGAFASVLLLDQLGTAGAGVLAASLAAGAALLLAPSRATGAGAVVVAVAALAALPMARGLLPVPTVDKRVGKMPAAAVLEKLADADRLVSFDRSDGRVDVIPAQPAPAILMDLGAAVARSPRPGDVENAPRDAASAAFLARPAAGGAVLVVGSAVGFEVARALAHGAARVDGVEVSSGVVAAARHEALPAARAVFADERVTLHLDEARSFLERSQEKWRHIVAVHTISNAAVAASALRLAEDFVLTRESLRAFLSHLDDDGVLYMTRPRAQIALLADLARDALRDRGVADAVLDDHLVLLEAVPEDPFFAGLLVFPRAPTAPLEVPRGVVQKPPPPPTGRELPTDDRPFFHRLSGDVGTDARARLRIEGPQLAEQALGWVGLLSTLVALFALVLPLRFRGGSGETALGRPAPAHLAVAALLGLGFMVVELSLAQRLTLLCGRPSVAFAAVVGGMLVGAGGVALILSRREVTLFAALGLSALACALSVGIPPLLDVTGALAWPAAGRAVLAAVAAAAVAAPLGLGFPALISATSGYAPNSAPWLYALNATTSVAATALHAAIAPSVGLGGTALVAAAAYAVAAGLARTATAPSDAS
jgi:hypothetical protein